MSCITTTTVALVNFTYGLRRVTIRVSRVDGHTNSIHIRGAHRRSPYQTVTYPLANIDQGRGHAAGLLRDATNAYSLTR